MSLRQQHEALAVSNPVNGLAYLHGVTGFKISACPRQQTTATATFRNLEPYHGTGERQISKGVPRPVVHTM